MPEILSACPRLSALIIPLFPSAGGVLQATPVVRAVRRLPGQATPADYSRGDYLKYPEQED